MRLKKAAVLLGCLFSVKAFAYEVDFNACVASLDFAREELASRGEPFRFWTTTAYPTGTQRPPLGLFNGGFMRHIQGATRLQSSNVFVFSGNAKGGAYLYTVRLASQPDFGDWRSNSKNTPTSDRVTKVLALGSTYPHPGGLQSVGHYVVAGTDIGRGKPSRVRFFDYSNPEAPRELTHLIISRTNVRADAVGAVRLRSGRYQGRYLVVVAALAKKRLSFYLSRTQHLDDGSNRFDLVNDWVAPGSFPSYQGIQLVEECAGALYLTGTFKTKPIPGLPWGGKDYLDFYKLHVEAGIPRDLDLIERKHMTLKQSFFTAGAGVYVDEQTGRLKVYSTDYWPLSATHRNTVIRFEEFSSR